MDKLSKPCKDAFDKALKCVRLPYPVSLGSLTVWRVMDNCGHIANVSSRVDTEVDAERLYEDLVIYRALRAYCDSDIGPFERARETWKVFQGDIEKKYKFALLQSL